MENIDQMRERHKGEINELQRKCKHKNISDWLSYEEAIRHYGSIVKLCDNCGAIRERKLLNTDTDATTFYVSDWRVYGSMI